MIARRSLGLFVLIFCPGPLLAEAPPAPTPKAGATRALLPAAAGIPGRPVVSLPVVPVLSPPLRETSALDAGPAEPRVARNEFPLPHRGTPAGFAAAEDPAVQRVFGLSAPSPSGVSFDGGSYGGNYPPDPTGAVGPNHYIQWVNVKFTVFDKAGTKLYGPANGTTLFTPLGGLCASWNDGDPVVSYDALADRWILTQFAVNPVDPVFSHQCVAVSRTGDPLGSWYLYDYMSGVDGLADYPKWAVWTDAYYMSAHLFDSNLVYDAPILFAFERTKMLAGLPARMQSVSLDPTGYIYGHLPATLDGLTAPPAGTPEIVLAPASPEIDGTPTPGLHLWSVSTTWGQPATMVVTKHPDVATAPFNANLCNFERNCVPQLGTTRGVDALSALLMYRLAFRVNGGVGSWLANQTVNVATPPANQAAVRWYELRLAGGLPAVYQQGTYAPDTAWRWVGSLAMDNAGNIALGYSKASTTQYPSIHVTGRLAGDPAGTMGAEVAMQESAGAYTDFNDYRWGDYTHMSIDPRDGCTFWYTNQFMPGTGTAWKSRVASYSFPGCTPPLAGTLAGMVTSGGSPVSGAVVLLASGHAAMTDATGSYSLVAPPGTYAVTARSDGGVCPATASGNVTLTNGGTTTKDFSLIALPSLTVGAASLDDSSGNGNAGVDPNECFKVDVPLTNGPCATATGVTGTLSTSTPGITVVVATRTWADIAAGATKTGQAPFELVSAPDFVCGTPIQLTFTLTSNAGTGSYPLSVFSCTAPTTQFVGAIPQSGLAQTKMLQLADPPSACGSLKATPTYSPDTGPWALNVHSFTNTSAFSRCVTVSTTGNCGLNKGVHTVAYFGPFDPNNSSTNYRADAGASYSPPTRFFSLDVPAGQTVNLVVYEHHPGDGCPLYYGTVTGVGVEETGGRPAPAITAPGWVFEEATNRVARVSAVSGHIYAWTITNGTITAGQGSNQINFTAGSPGTMALSVTETTAGGCSGQAEVTIPVVVPGAGFKFFTLPPCRVLDTRRSAPIASHGTLTVGLTGAPCGIPAGARSVSANIAETQPVGGGHLRIYPADGTLPLVSSLNFNSGQTRSNNAILTLSNDGTGRVSVYNGSGGTVHVLIDVNGYFE